MRLSRHASLPAVCSSRNRHSKRIKCSGKRTYRASCPPCEIKTNPSEGAVRAARYSVHRLQRVGLCKCCFRLKLIMRCQIFGLSFTGAMIQCRITYVVCFRGTRYLAARIRTSHGHKIHRDGASSENRSRTHSLNPAHDNQCRAN